MTPEELVEQAVNLIPRRPMQEDPPHIVLTGGEPLLHQDKLPTLIKLLRARGMRFVEIETNGTIEPQPEMLELAAWWNCSPKLTASEIQADARIKPEALRRLAESGKADFKFVVANEADLRDMEKTYLPLLPRDRIWLMPRLKQRLNMGKRMEQIARFCLMRGYRLSSRLQILIWDERRGR